MIDVKGFTVHDRRVFWRGGGSIGNLADTFSHGVVNHQCWSGRGEHIEISIRPDANLPETCAHVGQDALFGHQIAFVLVLLLRVAGE